MIPTSTVERWPGGGSAPEWESIPRQLNSGRKVADEGSSPRSAPTSLRQGCEAMETLFLSWTTKMSVGVEVLDNDHKRLIEMINDLHDGIGAGHGTERLGKILTGLVEYTHSHLAREEALLQRSGYPDLVAHQKAHQQLIERIGQIQQRYNRGDFEALSLNAMDCLKDWMTVHVMDADKKYQEHLNLFGIR